MPVKRIELVDARLTLLVKNKFDMNALPEDFLQLMQWHTLKVIGSPVTSYFTVLHKQEPLRMVRGGEEEEDAMTDARRLSVVRCWGNIDIRMSAFPLPVVFMPLYSSR